MNDDKEEVPNKTEEITADSDWELQLIEQQNKMMIVWNEIYQ